MLSKGRKDNDLSCFKLINRLSKMTNARKQTAIIWGYCGNPEYIGTGNAGESALGQAVRLVVRRHRSLHPHTWIQPLHSKIQIPPEIRQRAGDIYVSIASS